MIVQMIPYGTHAAPISFPATSYSLIAQFKGDTISFFPVGLVIPVHRRGDAVVIPGQVPHVVIGKAYRLYRRGISGRGIIPDFDQPARIIVNIPGLLVFGIDPFHQVPGPVIRIRGLLTQGPDLFDQPVVQIVSSTNS